MRQQSIPYAPASSPSSLQLHPQPPPPPPPPPPPAQPVLKQTQHDGGSIKFSLPKQASLPATKALPVDEEDVTPHTVKQGERRGAGAAQTENRGSSGDWPQSLKDYVNQAFAKCRSDQEKDEVEHLLKAKLTVAYHNNTVWSTDWRREPPLDPSSSFSPSLAACKPRLSPPTHSSSHKKYTSKAVVRAKKGSRGRSRRSSSGSSRSSSRSRSRSPVRQRRASG